jgi:hypothetical protein
MKKKYYVFRPSGEDEGEVALLTRAEYRKIQKATGPNVTGRPRPGHWRAALLHLLRVGQQLQAHHADLGCSSSITTIS